MDKNDPITWPSRAFCALALALLAASSPLAAAPASPTTAHLPVPAPDLQRTAFIADMDREYRLRDADGDGKVTRTELEQWERRKIIAAAQASNRQLFARLDVDRDGKLSPGEFAALVKDPGPVDVGPLMARFDSNRDQIVSLVEFRAGTLANFDRLDADHDGVVTAAEMKASPPPPKTTGR